MNQYYKKPEKLKDDVEKIRQEIRQVL